VCSDDLLIFDSRVSKRFLNTPTRVKPRPTVVSVANEKSRLFGHPSPPHNGLWRSFPPGLETIHEGGSNQRRTDSRRRRGGTPSFRQGAVGGRDALGVPNIRPLLPEGVYHWTATHPEWEGPVSAYAIDDGARLILIDPIAVPDEVRALFGSREVVTVLTSTWHERDAAALDFPVWAPAPDRPEDQLVPATRYAIGESLFGMEAYPGREGQLDLVLWSERIRAVIAGDTLIDLGNGLEIPASWLPEGVTVEQVAAGLRPLLDKPVDIVLPTHGEPADRAALERALA
jgi:hypothetical protein